MKFPEMTGILVGRPRDVSVRTLSGHKAINRKSLRKRKMPLNFRPRRHHGQVSIPIRFFSAADDAAAAETLDRDPESVQETMIRDRFLASSAMTEWESILTGRSPEGHAQAAPPVVVADDRPRSSSKILAASPELRAALAAADQARLTEAAHQWVDQYRGQNGNFEFSEVKKILQEMARLSRMADAEQEGVYFWMC